MSRIGKKPLAVPKEIKVGIEGSSVTVEGPKGKLELSLPFGISAELKDGQVFVKRCSDSKRDKAMHGLYRALILNMINGCNTGYIKELEIIGTGFKAAVQADTLSLQVGYSHPVNFKIPQGIKVESPKPNRIIVSGINKEMVGEIAAEIRSVFPPEPYKGKGIRYLGEVVKKKVGKAQATTK